MAILNTEITQDIEEPFSKSAAFHFDKSATKGKKITDPKTEKNSLFHESTGKCWIQFSKTFEIRFKFGSLKIE